MSNVAALLTAITGLLGSLTTLVGMVVVIRRTSPRERRDAAQGVAEQVMTPHLPAAIEEAAALVDIEQERERRRD